MLTSEDIITILKWWSGLDIAIQEELLNYYNIETFKNQNLISLECYIRFVEKEKSIDVYDAVEELREFFVNHEFDYKFRSTPMYMSGGEPSPYSRYLDLIEKYR